MPDRPMTLEELAAQANVPAEELPDDAEFEQAMTERSQAPAARPRTRSATGPRTAANGQQVGGLTGLPIGPRPVNATPDGEAAPGGQAGLLVINEPAQHVFTDSAGNEQTILLEVGTRINVGHEHNGDVRRPSCAICMGIWEHERQLRQSNRPQAEARTQSRTVMNEDTAYDMTDSAGDEYQFTVPAGATIITKEGHEHSNKRIPTCAICMAINEHERSIQPERVSVNAPKDCECSCGGRTKGGRFLPGHDARLYGRVKRYNEWYGDNSEKIANGEIPPTAFSQYEQIPEAIRTSGVLRTGHGEISLEGHPLAAA